MRLAPSPRPHRSRDNSSHLKLVKADPQLALDLTPKNEWLEFEPVPEGTQLGLKLDVNEDQLSLNFDSHGSIPEITIDLTSPPSEAGASKESANLTPETDSLKLVLFLNYLPPSVRASINRILGIDLRETTDSIKVTRSAAKSVLDALRESLESAGVKVEIHDSNETLVFSPMPSDDAWSATGHQ